MTLALRLVVLLSLLPVAEGAQAQVERSFMLRRLDPDRFHDVGRDDFDVRDVGRHDFDVRAEVKLLDLKSLRESFDVAPGFRQFHKVLVWNFTEGLFSTDNIGPLMAGSAATMAALPFDERLSDALRDEADWVDDSGNVIGSAVTLAAATGTLLLIAPFTDNQKFKSFSFTMAQAVILDGALISVLKLSVSRQRPNGHNDNSFASFHASGTTAVATLLQHYYGWKWGVPAYAVAGFVAFSRVEGGQHYLSDVIFGATLGYIAGMTAIRGTDRSVAQRRLTVYPIVGNRRRGAAVLLEF